jgi:protein-S-isoprenylcysteine O-methyltransferase Ste14
MEPNVLAGPVEFSPAEIALMIAVLVAIFVAVTAPGWAVLGFAAHRRRKAQRPGPAWGAAVVGGISGLVVCFGVASLLGALSDSLGMLGVVVAVVASWVACWAIAYAITPRSTVSAPDTSPASGGWGR